MTLHHPIAESILLALTVLCCWIGVAGMLRMKDPTQALHYLSMPAVGSILLTAAVFVETGSSQASWKTLFIAVMLFAINSVVTHATARAFRTRALGHWQPRAGESIDFVRDTTPPDQRRNA